MEIDVTYPPYQAHDTNIPDGFGDPVFLAKYRLKSANERNGNYLVTAWVNGSIPTGTNRNGSSDASIAMNCGGGKGFGNFDLQSMIGVTLPVREPSIRKNGHPLAWNNVLQWRFATDVTLELENNATFYLGGTHDGAMQNFITPEVTLGKIKLIPRKPESRLGVMTGVGMQFAVSDYRSYDRAVVSTFRLAF